MTLPVLPTATELFEAARKEIVSQHERLRPRLRATLDGTRAAIKDGAPADELRTAVTMVLAELDCHMAYEESLLLPILSNNRPAGPEEAAAMRADHERQRLQIKTLLELVSEGSTVAEFGVPLQSLIADVLLDMDDEEQTMANERITAEMPAWSLH